MKIRAFMICLGLLSMNIGTVVAAPSSEVKVKCGEILEGEFTKPKETHKYRVKMAPGDDLQVVSTPIGDYLAVGIYINGPSGISVFDQDRGSPGTLTAKTKKLSGRGFYDIHVTNIHRRYDGAGYLGVYNLSVACTLRDGTVIAAGG